MIGDTPCRDDPEQLIGGVETGELNIDDVADAPLHV